MGDDAIEGGLYIGFNIMDLRRKKQQALLGYMCIDLLDPPAGAQWGHFNDRLVDPSWIRGLMESYEKGVDNCTDVTTIDATVKRHWVSNLDKIMPSTEGEHIENVPMMMFTEAGMQEMVPNNFWMLGGNHRRLALDFWVKEQKKQLEIQRRLSGKLQKEQSTGYDIEKDQLIQEADQAICDLDEKIKKSRKWVLRLYDRGECDRVSAMRICE